MIYPLNLGNLHMKDLKAFRFGFECPKIETLNQASEEGTVP